MEQIFDPIICAVIVTISCNTSSIKRFDETVPTLWDKVSSCSALRVI